MYRHIWARSQFLFWLTAYVAQHHYDLFSRYQHRQIPFHIHRHTLLTLHFADFCNCVGVGGVKTEENITHIRIPKALREVNNLLHAKTSEEKAAMRLQVHLHCSSSYVPCSCSHSVSRLSRVFNSTRTRCPHARPSTSSTPEYSPDLVVDWYLSCAWLPFNPSLLGGIPNKKSVCAQYTGPTDRD